MNAYQVTYEVDEGTTNTVHVSAVSHQAAQYAAFDELTDRSIAFRRFVFTQIWHSESSQWVMASEHGSGVPADR